MMSGITLLQNYNLVNFDKVSKINFDYLFIWIDWFRLWSLFNSVHLNAAFFIITDNGASEHYTELEEVGKSNTYDKIVSYAN